MKIGDNRSIDKLEQSLREINKRFSANKKATELVQFVEETLLKMRETDFLDEVSFSLDFKDKELVENENNII